MAQVVDLLDTVPDHLILVDLPLVIMDLITMDLTIPQATRQDLDNIPHKVLQVPMDLPEVQQEVQVQKTVITIPQTDLDLDTNQ